MATRSGDVPEDALFYLLRQKFYDDVSLEHMLYHKSGLLGLSETSGDMRELQNSDDPRARQAFDYFVYAIVKYAGAYASVLGGLDALVFTAGIGKTPRRFVPPFARNSSGLGFPSTKRRIRRTARVFPRRTAVFRCGSFPPMKS